MASSNRNGNWKGGKSIASNGYVLVRVGLRHHLADVRGYAYEHRLVAESKTGRKLEKGEQVHHINGNKQDNRPDNIEVMKSLAHHLNKHRKGHHERRLADQPNPMMQCSCGCGEWFNRFDSTGRPRKFISGHNPSDSSKRDAVLAMAEDRKAIHTKLITPLLSSKQAAKVMLSRLVKEGKLIRMGRGYYGPQPC